MRHRLHPLAIAIVALMAAPANAEGTPRQLDEVSVEARPAAELPKARVVADDRLRAGSAASSDSARLLQDVPGLSLYGAGGVSSLPAIHGLADDRVRIKLDGMDLIATCPNHMNPPLSYVAPAQIASVSVFAGIAPVSLGGDSLAGSIVVDTAAPRFSDDGELQTSAGIDSHYRSNGDAYGVDLRAAASGLNYQLSYSGSVAKSANYLAGGEFRGFGASGRPGHTLALDEVGSTAYETRNHQLGLATRIGEHLLEAKFGYQDMPFQGYPNQRMDLVDNRQTRINLRYQLRRDTSTLDLRAYHEDVEHRMDFGDDRRYWYGADSMLIDNPVDGAPCAPISPTCAAGMPMESQGRTDGAALKLDLSPNERDLLRVGAEYQAYRLDDRWPASGGAMWPGEFVNVNDGRRDRAAAYAEWERRYSSRWTSLLGLRYENVRSDAGEVRGYDIDAAPPGSYMMTAADAAEFNASKRQRSDDNLDLTLLARHAASATLDIEFGFARKTRSPNLYERYTWSSWAMAATMNNFVGDGNGYVGDVNLAPEVAHTLAATIDWHRSDRATYLKATPYLTRVHDFIDAVALTSNAGQFNLLRYANREARLYGIDLSAAMPIADTRYGRFGIDALLGYTRGDNLDSDQSLYNIMPLNAKFGLDHRQGRWHNRLEWQLVDAKDRLSGVRNEIRTHGYGLLALRSSIEWRKLRVDVGVDNLFDRLYDLPLGGAYVGQGRTMSISATPYGIAVPGMGRSFYMGFSLDL